MGGSGSPPRAGKACGAAGGGVMHRTLTLTLTLTLALTLTLPLPQP